MSDAVNHPDHYNSMPNGIECIDVIEHFNFNLGNAIKYIWRCQYKHNLIEDLEKAIWYLQREIDRVKKLTLIADNISSTLDFDNSYQCCKKCQSNES